MELFDDEFDQRRWEHRETKQNDQYILHLVDHLVGRFGLRQLGGVVFSFFVLLGSVLDLSGGEFLDRELADEFIHSRMRDLSLLADPLDAFEGGRMGEAGASSASPT